MQPHLQLIVDEPVVYCGALGVAHAAVIHGNAIFEDRLQGIGEILRVPPGQSVDDGWVCAACKGPKEFYNNAFGCSESMRVMAGYVFTFENTLSVWGSSSTFGCCADQQSVVGFELPVAAA